MPPFNQWHCPLRHPSGIRQRPLLSKDFTAANSVICGLTGLSLTRMLGVRKELIDKGYLHYTKGYSNQCGTYTSVDLVKENPALPIKPTPEMVKSDSSTDNSMDNSTDSSMDTLNKPTQLKPNQRALWRLRHPYPRRIYNVNQSLRAGHHRSLHRKPQRIHWSDWRAGA